MKIRKRIATYIALALTLTALFASLAFSVFSATDVTFNEYGLTIPSSDQTTNFVAYGQKAGESEWTKVGSWGGLRTGFLNGVKDRLANGSGAYEGGTVFGYMTANVTHKEAGSNGSNASFDAGLAIDGTFVYDLGGNKLNVQGKCDRVFGFSTASNWLKGDTDYDTTLIVQNGTIESYKTILDLYGSSAGAYSGNKNVNVIFNNVTFTADLTGTYRITQSRTTFLAGQSATLNLTFNNCTFDYPNVDTLIIYDDRAGNNADGNNAVTTNVTFNGGTIKTKNANSLTVFGGQSENDTCIFTPDENGARTEFVFNYTETAPALSFNTDKGEMHLAPNRTTDKKTTTYELTNVKTKYGYVPASKASTAFLIFYNDIYLDARANYYNALDRAKALLYPTNGVFKGEELTILLTDSYNHKDNLYMNLAQLDGKITLDLNEKAITLNNNPLFDVVGKSVAQGLPETNVSVKNGTIRTCGTASVARINSTSNFEYDGVKRYNFAFDNVTFDKSSDAENYVQIISSGTYFDTKSVPTKKMNFTAVFNDCDFVTPNSSILFDLSASDLITSDITVNGGSLKTDSIGIHGIMIKHETAINSLKLGKNGEGKYMTLTMPKSATNPTVKFNGSLEFVRVSEDGDNASFELKENGLNAYLPKMSLTLASSLTMNVYVPKERTLGFTFDGITYSSLDELSAKTVTLSDGKEYYHLTVELPAASAARDVTLDANVSYGEGYVPGRFTFSIPKYAIKVIKAGSEVEKSVARDVVSYVKSAYVYFDTATDEVMAKFNAILGDNYSADYTSGEYGEATDAFASATFNLTSTPAIRFYLKDGASASNYSFKINGKTVPFTTGDAYVEINVFAYSMCEAIECFENGNSVGSYHISSYLKWAENQNDESLVNLVKAFWKYAESAKAYKESVKTVINYVDENGNKLTASREIYSVCGESFKLLSPAIDGYYTRDIYVSFTADVSKAIDVVYKPIPENASAEEISKLLYDITAWGDSITAGASSDNTTMANKYGIDLEALGSTTGGATYAAVLENLISRYVYNGIDVANSGVGGESTATIAARANTENYYLYIATEAVIGASPVVIDLQQKFPDNVNPARLGVLRKDLKDHLSHVTIVDANGASVEGIITCAMPVAPSASNNQIYNCDYSYLEYTFTRTDGKTDTVNLGAGSRVIMNASVDFDGRTCIIFMGENNGYSDANTSNRNIDNLIAQQKEILKACGIDYENGNNRYLIVSTTSGTNESRKEITERLTAEWGDHYINIGNEINSRRAYELAGYSDEAIASVEANISEGSVTELLLADGCHPNAVGYAVIGNLIFERFFDLGLFDDLFEYYDALNS